MATTIPIGWYLIIGLIIIEVLMMIVTLVSKRITAKQFKEATLWLFGAVSTLQVMIYLANQQLTVPDVDTNAIAGTLDEWWQDLKDLFGWRW